MGQLNDATTGAIKISSRGKTYSGSASALATALTGTVTDNDGNFLVVSSELSDGSYLFTVTATDSAGNISSISNSISAFFFFFDLLNKYSNDFIPKFFIFFPLTFLRSRICANWSFSNVIFPSSSVTIIPSPRSSRTDPNWSLCFAISLILDFKLLEISEILRAKFSNWPLSCFNAFIYFWSPYSVMFSLLVLAAIFTLTVLVVY